MRKASHSCADVSLLLADLAVSIDDASGLGIVCEAIECGRLTRDSTSAARAALAGGNSAIESRLRSLQETWAVCAPELSPQSLSLLLRASVASVAAFRRRAPRTEVVWTGPNVEGSFLRTTREVVRELLCAVEKELLVVGYWIAARSDGEGIIEEVIAALAEAVDRGVALTVIVDERVRQDGRDNRHVLLSAWPGPIRHPTILTWRLPPTDQFLKLHAKVLVADRRDALITSANLTSYALDRNMEMGVRIVGRPALEIARHFDLLALEGVLEPYSDNQGLA